MLKGIVTQTERYVQVKSPQYAQRISGLFGKKCTIRRSSEALVEICASKNQKIFIELCDDNTNSTGFVPDHWLARSSSDECILGMLFKGSRSSFPKHNSAQGDTHAHTAEVSASMSHDDDLSSDSCCDTVPSSILVPV